MSEYQEDQEAKAMELMFQSALTKVEQQRGALLKPEGLCHNCKEKVSGCRLFCDADCSSDYEKVQRSRRMSSR